MIGGAQIYNAFFEKGIVDSVELTLVHGNHTGDVYVQEFRNHFQEVKRIKGEMVDFITLSTEVSS